VADIAAFVQRPSARWYSAACSEYGVDPAAFLADDVLAANLRVGLLWRPPEPETPENVAERDAQRAQRAREGARQIDALMGT
jgi:hypothetical protein